MASVAFSSTSSSLATLSFPRRHRRHHPPLLRRALPLPVARSLSLDFSGSFFEAGGGGGSGEDGEDEGFGGGGMSAAAAAAAAMEEEREAPQCPPGLRQYETMAVLRPDMNEDQRLTLIQRYEELLVTGGAMYVEVFNRGVIPLAYSIKKKNKDGETNTYFDGIYLLFTYFTKPESMPVLEVRLNTDDDVIRASNFKIRKRKLP